MGLLCLTQALRKSQFLHHQIQPHHRYNPPPHPFHRIGLKGVELDTLFGQSLTIIIISVMFHTIIIILGIISYNLTSSCKGELSGIRLFGRSLTNIIIISIRV